VCEFRVFWAAGELMKLLLADLRSS
jgi:hypothetical protein